MADRFPRKLTPSDGAVHALLAILACLLWSSAFAGTKIALSHVSALPLAGMRYVVAGILLIPFIPWRLRTVAQIRRSWRFILLVALLHTVIVCGLFMVGMQWAQGAQAAILIGASPLISALAAHFMMPDDRMDVAKVGVILLGICGVAIIIVGSKPWQPACLRELLGMSLVVVCMISGAVSNVVIARRRRRINPLLLNSLQMALGGLVLGCLGVISGQAPTSVPPARFFVALGYLSMVSAAAFSIWFYLLRRVKVSRLNMWKFLIPVFGAIISWLVLPGESPTVWMVGGMVLVAAAVLLNAGQGGRAEGRPVS